MKTKRRIIFEIAILILIMIMCSGCGGTQKSISDDSGEEEREIYAMDTYMTVKAYGGGAKEAVDKAEERIRELDSKLSTGIEESEVYQINKNGGGVLSEDGVYLLKRSLELWDSTDRTFNPAIYPIMELWGFTTKDYQVPDEDEISDTLKLTDADNIIFDEKTGKVSFKKDGMKLDFGGVAKGYTSDCIMKIFKECGIKSGIVSLGGNVHVLGNKPDGSDFRIAIRNPDTQQDSYIGVLEASDCAVITSGGYERYFEKDGVIYHHIIDSETGYPADNGLKSVTIVSKDGTLADILSTSLYIMGLDKASDYWYEHREKFDVIFVDDSGTVYITGGIEKNFESEYDVRIIK